MADAGSGGFEYGGCVAFMIRDAAEQAIIKPQADEKINLGGTALAAGVGIKATGAGKSCVLCPTADVGDGSETDGWDYWGTADVFVTE